MDSGEWIFVVVGVAIAALLITGIYLAWRIERDRLRGLAAACDQLGLSFSRKQDRDLAHRFAFVPELNDGENRHAFDVIKGVYRACPVVAFDHHFEHRSTDEKGNSSTSHHYHHVFALVLPVSFPGVCIVPEDMFSKIAQGFGYEDIDFESHEFSRRFCVRSADRRFAYDFCHPGMMEFLLERQRMRLFLDGRLLATVHDGKMDAMELRAGLDDLVEIHARIPAFLLT